MLKKISFSAVVIIVERILSIGLILFADSIIARSLTTRDYGQWQYVLNASIVASSFGLVLGNEVLLPAFVRNRGLVRQIYLSSFLIRAFFSAIAAVVFLIIFQFIDLSTGMKLAVPVMAISILLLEPSAVVISYLQSQGKQLHVAAIRISGLIARMLMVFFGSLNSSMISLTSGARAIEALPALAGYCWIANKLKQHAASNVRSGKIMLMRGIRFLPALTLMYLYQRGDKLLIKHTFGFEVLASYSIVSQIVDQVVIVTNLLLQASLPFVADHTGRRSLGGARATGYYVSIAVIISTLAFIALGVAGPTLIELIFTSKYNQSAKMIPVMSVAVIPLSIDLALCYRFFTNKAYVQFALKCLLSFLAMSAVFTNIIIPATDLQIEYRYIIMAVLSLFGTILIHVFNYVKLNRRI